MKRIRQFLTITSLLVSVVWIEVLAALVLSGHRPESGFPAWIAWTPAGLYVVFVYCEYFWRGPRKK